MLYGQKWSNCGLVAVREFHWIRVPVAVASQKQPRAVAPFVGQIVKVIFARTLRIVRTDATKYKRAWGGG